MTGVAKNVHSRVFIRGNEPNPGISWWSFCARYITHTTFYLSRPPLYLEYRCSFLARRTRIDSHFYHICYKTDVPCHCILWDQLTVADSFLRELQPLILFHLRATHLSLYHSFTSILEYLPQGLHNLLDLTSRFKRRKWQHRRSTSLLSLERTVRAFLDGSELYVRRYQLRRKGSKMGGQYTYDSQNISGKRDWSWNRSLCNEIWGGIDSPIWYAYHDQRIETASLALENLKQGKDEDLRSYYNRTEGNLEEAWGQDFRDTTPPQPFSTIERSFLNHKLIRCLINETVITRTFGYNAQPSQSFSEVYSKAELNLVQLKVEGEQYEQVQEQNHARLLQDIANALLEGKQPHLIEGILAQLEISRGSRSTVHRPCGEGTM